VTEGNQIHSNVRRHLGPIGLWLRFEDRFQLGVPDWHYVARGRTGWLEAKVIQANGACPSHFTRDQLMWGEAYAAAGGLWHLLGLVLAKTPSWRLYDVRGARAWFEGGDGELFDISGRLPTREVLDQVAPL